MDVDIVAAIAVSQTSALAAGLGKDWYADPEQMREAIAHGRSFNLIHMYTSEKFDIFPACGEFHLSQLERAAVEDVLVGGETIQCPVATAEDILLAKLQWYRSGGETSERQWGDIAAIVEVNTSLDQPYLQLWAARLGVADLLDRALASR
jgi:hypothetical protein